MKIAVFDPYLDVLGGGEKYMMSAAECLSQDNEVSILWDNKEDIEKIEDRFGLDLSNIKVAPNLFSKKFNLITRLQKSREYDVMFYLSDGSIPLVGSKKLILHLQFPIEWVTINLKTKLKLKRVNRVVVNSEYTKKFIDKKLGIESRVVYPPVSINRTDSPKENIILHVGRFMKTGVEGNDYKKQYFMIDSFKKLVDSGLKGWKFVIGASVRTQDLADFQKMQATAAGYPISFIVNTTNQDLWKSYNNAKIYWHASGFGEDLNKHPERAEHFGISTVEAMGAGAVPIVVNAGGQREIITDGVNGLLWNTQEELINTTQAVIDDESKRSKLEKKAVDSAKKFSKEKFCELITQCVK